MNNKDLLKLAKEKLDRPNPSTNQTYKRYKAFEALERLGSELDDEEYRVLMEFIDKDFDYKVIQVFSTLRNYVQDRTSS